MEIEFSQMMVLFACVFLGGLVDSIAGGGGLITLPAYYAVGIPAHMALGTNKFANAIGTLTASVRFFKEKQINIKVALIAAAGALVGSPLGAKLAMAIDEKYLNYILLVAVPLIAIMVLRKRTLEKNASRRCRCCARCCCRRQSALVPVCTTDSLVRVQAPL